jgi:hypothetical protein
LNVVQFVIFFGWPVPHQALDKQYKLYIFFFKEKSRARLTNRKPSARFS